ncbi:DUF2254 domain-containing protein [Palleronia caenipelagi]|uniref:DUF2254 domain-containing protein n=1 Tax=Palleronia caenipelagi TaxID=2489174 RepID=A0A547PXQ5_9RHOB|nr:DUF2254 domain-containing protein [Palleronia caenipelagi]TRD18941.1 DUF2254 domain-containing protein [Palleronia caenipelagi]
MIRNLMWRLRIFSRKLWIRASLISLLAVAGSLLAPLSNYLPFKLTSGMNMSTLENLLGIITSTMLSVATFSLSIMVSSHLAADTSATPRAYRLLQQDGRTQTVIATFIGAFVYALTLTIMLDLGFVQDNEVALVYILTIVVIIAIVIALLRWVAHLDGLGSVERTLRQTEDRITEAITEQGRNPFLGGLPALGHAVSDAVAVRAEKSGFVQQVNMRDLQEVAKENGVQIHLEDRPGNWVTRGDILARIVGGELGDEAQKKIFKAIAINDRREPDQDVGHALMIMSEIGDRALSPGTNDPQTGVNAISRITRLIMEIPVEEQMDEPVAPDVYAPPLDMRALVRESLYPLARDGAGFVEVVVSVQRACAVLTRHPNNAVATAARQLSADSLALARDAMRLAGDVARIEEIAVASSPSEII